MNRKSVFFPVLLCVLSLFLTGCMSSMSTGSSEAKTVATGSAGGANAQNANSDVLVDVHWIGGDPGKEEDGPGGACISNEDQ